MQLLRTPQRPLRWYLHRHLHLRSRATASKRATSAARYVFWSTPDSASYCTAVAVQRCCGSKMLRPTHTHLWLSRVRFSRVNFSPRLAFVPHDRPHVFPRTLHCTVCGQARCGTCGGSGCSSRGNGLTGFDCCQSKIVASGRLCSVTGQAPCFMDGEHVCGL